MSVTKIEIAEPARGVMLGGCAAPKCQAVATKLVSFDSDAEPEVEDIKLVDHPLCKVHAFALVAGAAYETSGLSDE